MKNKMFLPVLLVVSLSFYGCTSSGNQNQQHAVMTYELWTQLHDSPSLAAVEAFFENIEKYDFSFTEIYPGFAEQAMYDKYLMSQKKQVLLDLLRNNSSSAELELEINDVVNQIDVLMIHYIQNRNYVIEESHNRYMTFYIMLIAVIVILATVLIFLNERELKKKDNRIFQSESVLRHTMEVQEAERIRISRDLHDTVAQSMRYVSILAEKIADRELADTIISVQNNNIEDIRKMCYSLTPPSFKNMNIVDSLNILADKTFVMEKTQVRIITDGNIDFSGYTEEQFINIYRIIQELFQNISKHAEASEVTVLFRKEEHLKIIISDDGKGMDSKIVSEINSKTFDISQNLHFGIRNVLERVQLLSGTISYRSDEDCGTTIVIEI